MSAYGCCQGTRGGGAHTDKILAARACRMAPATSPPPRRRGGTQAATEQVVRQNVYLREQLAATVSVIRDAAQAEAGDVAELQVRTVAREPTVTIWKATTSSSRK